MSLSIRNLFVLMFVWSCSMTLTACGQAMGDLATSVLYPMEFANETPVPEVPPRDYQVLKLDVDNDPDDVEVKKLSIHSWYKVHKDSRKPVVVYFHGNGMNLGSMHQVGLTGAMDTFETHWVAMDYPGYGHSTGMPSMVTIGNATDALMVWVKRKFPKSKIIVWGRSLGAAVASQVVKRHQDKVSHFILTSGWNDFMTVAKSKAGPLAGSIPKAWIAKNNWDSATAAEDIGIPGLQHHGDKDTLIKLKFGKRLWESFPNGNVNFVEVKGYGHNDIFGDSAYWDEVEEFIHAH